MPLPHRPPYLLVDRREGDLVHAAMPEHPALLVEVCAQACGLLGDEAPSEAAALIGVRRFTFERRPEPGSAIRVRAEVKGRLRGQALFHCVVEDAAGLVAAGDLALAL